MNVVLIGATHKPDRYAYQALKLLLEKGHRVFPVHPRLTEVEGVRVYQTLPEIQEPVHTITLYVGASRSDSMAGEIFGSNPKRIIFNPGAENEVLEERARSMGIEAVRGCTLVMLKTSQF